MSSIVKRFTLLAAIVMLLTGCARNSGVQVDAAWSRAMAPGMSVGVVYLTIRNHSGQADELLSASTARASSVELHGTSIRDGVSVMDRLSSLPIAAGENVQLAPGGLHFMLLGMPTPLQAGERFPLTLTFARYGEIVVEVHARAPNE